MEYINLIFDAIYQGYIHINLLLYDLCIWLIVNHRIFIEPWLLGVLIFGPFVVWEIWCWYKIPRPPKSEATDQGRMDI